MYLCAFSSIYIQELKDVPNNMGQDVNLHLMESFQDENDTSDDTDLQTLRVIVSWIQNNSTKGNLWISVNAFYAATKPKNHLLIKEINLNIFSAWLEDDTKANTQGWYVG